jgi:hypothetical protein
MGFVDTMKSGEWLTAARIRGYSLILAGLTAVAVAALVATSNGMVDFQGRPLGTDFSNVWSAGRMVLDGHPAAPFDPQLHRAEQQAIFADPDIGFYGWHYPPFFLVAAALLALLPYVTALAVWQAATLPAYLLAIRRILPAQGAVLAAAAFPAVLVNITHGQNGFLTAGLIAGALLLVDRRPVLAGVLIGLLAYKPQFGILIPLVLAISGRWTAFAAAAATVAAMAAATVALFGIDSLAFTRTVVLEAGTTGWEKIQSVFAAVRMWGGPTGLAYGAQFALVLAAATAWLWRAGAPLAVRASALIVASLLATPYVLDYDMIVLGPAIAWFAAHGLERGFLTWEKSALALAFFAPLIARSIAGAVLVPVGLIAMTVLFAIIIRRARHDLAPAAEGAPSHGRL